MDYWTIDGDYVYRNFGIDKNVYIVQDSDEMMLVSWAPLSDRALPLTPNARFSWPWIGKLLRQATLRTTYISDIFDPLKREIFLLPVRWHVNELNKNWAEKEKDVSSLIFGALAPELPNEALSECHIKNPLYLRFSVQCSRAAKVLLYLSIMLAHWVTYIFKWLDFLAYIWTGKMRIWRVLVLAAKGDRTAIARVKHRLLFFINKAPGLSMLIRMLMRLLVYISIWLDFAIYLWTGRKRIWWVLVQAAKGDLTAVARVKRAIVFFIEPRP
mgnify:FL=1